MDICLFVDKETPYCDIKNWVQPDLIVVCNETQIESKRIIGAPDLVIEILSPATARNNRVLKYNKYEQAGVKEYWIVDPYNQTIEVNLLEKRTGHYFREDKIRANLFSDLEIDLKNVFSLEDEEE
ncbi:Uma2 family endonuclease [Fictibacillus sp. Mic-4]|uniref:Uma2 family endonuclease n=1 Tax=Fictibacillus sp. Mic-4 TaxID=3132826 RepID=UPI0009D78720